MAFARDVYTATGGQTDFTISYSYEDNDHIQVIQNGTTLTETTDYTFPNATTVRLNSGATLNDTIVLERATSQSTKLVDFTAGVLTEADLDNAIDQVFYMAQEAIDQAEIRLGKDSSEIWDATSIRIQNVGTPTADSDAATKTYVDNAALSGATLSGDILPDTDSSRSIGSTSGPLRFANLYVDNLGDTGQTMTVTGSVNFDSNTLFVDHTNNRVGVGTASPVGTLQINATQPTLTLVDTNAAADNGTWHFQGTSSDSLAIQALTDAGAGGGDYITFERTNQQIDSITLWTSGAERTRLNTDGSAVFEGDVKLGGATTDTPSARLHVSETATGNAAIVESTAAQSGTYGPTIEVHRNSTGSLAAHGQGVIKFAVDNSSNAKVTMGQLYLTTSDMTASSETGYMTLSATASGSEASVFRAYGNRFNVGLDTYIGDLGATPSARLHVADDGATIAQFDSSRTPDGTPSPTLALLATAAASSGNTSSALNLRGTNASSIQKNLCLLYTTWRDATNGAEDTDVQFQCMDGGSATNVMRVGGPSINTTKDMKIGGTITDTPSAPLHVFETTAETDTVIIESNEAGANWGPGLNLYRNSVSAANGDTLGYLKFTGEDFAGADHIYAAAYAQIIDATNPTEDGTFVIQSSVSGTPTAAIQWHGGNQKQSQAWDTYIGDVNGTPSARLHVSDTATGIVGVLESTAAQSTTGGPYLDLSRNSTGSASTTHAHGGIRFLADSTTDTSREVAGIIVQSTDMTNGAEDGRMQFRTVVAGTTAPRMYLSQGLYMAGASGGNQGADTINAGAVYDDGSGPLTDYVLDRYVDGYIDFDHYAKDEFGDGAARAWNDQDLDIDTYVSKWKARKALPPFMTKEEREENGRAPIGKMVQGLMETVEVMAVHISKLNERIKKLENQSCS
jgi:hypothetical protein